MFAADLDLVRLPVEVSLDIAFDKRFRVYRARLRGTVTDTELVPPLAGAPTDFAILFVLLDGEIAFDAPASVRIHAGHLFVATQDAIEGARGKRAVTYVARGEPYQVLQIRVDRALIGIPFADADPKPLPASTALLDAARLYATEGTGPAGRRDAPLANLLRTLHREHLLAEDLSLTIARNHAIDERLWNTLVPLYRRLYLAPSMTELAEGAGLSIRHLGRAITNLVTRVDLPWLGLRESALRIRLRIAVFLLANDAVPVAEIATRTGYSSVEAMNHAFRDAGLPPPSAARARILARQRDTFTP